MDGWGVGGGDGPGESFGNWLRELKRTAAEPFLKLREFTSSDNESHFSPLTFKTMG